MVPIYIAPQKNVAQKKINTFFQKNESPWLTDNDIETLLWRILLLCKETSLYDAFFVVNISFNFSWKIMKPVRGYWKVNEWVLPYSQPTTMSKVKIDWCIQDGTN